MTFTQAHLNKINVFEEEANDQDFNTIFGSTLGPHLYNKFAHYEFSIIRLWSALDLANQRLLLNHFNKQP